MHLERVISMEIEKKFLIHKGKIQLKEYPFVTIEQGYICTDPVIRIRKKDDDYFITYKSSGLMVRQEFEEMISQEQYNNLKKKVDYHLIKKRRYLVPISHGLTAEVDVFDYHLEGLVMAEVEFSTEEMANAFKPPHWFRRDVTFNPLFHNSHLCQESNLHFLKHL